MPRIRQPGLYIISNEKEKKVYIGSSIDLKQRVQKHKSELVNNAHSNYRLQMAFNATENKDDFKVTYIPTAPDVKVRELEQKLLDEFALTGNLYNIATNVDAPSLGKKHSPETIAKLKELAKGRVPPREAVKNSVAARKGVPLSDERKQQISERSKKAMEDPEAREHLRQVNLGVKRTPEQIANMKEACVGRTFTPQAIEARLKATIGKPIHPNALKAIIEANTGSVKSPETRARMSEAQKGKIFSPEHIAKCLATRAANKIKKQQELSLI